MRQILHRATLAVLALHRLAENRAGLVPYLVPTRGKSYGRGADTGLEALGVPDVQQRLLQRSLRVPLFLTEEHGGPLRRIECQHFLSEVVHMDLDVWRNRLAFSHLHFAFTAFVRGHLQLYIDHPFKLLTTFCLPLIGQRVIPSRPVFGKGLICRILDGDQSLLVYWVRFTQNDTWFECLCIEFWH